jgi:plasmid stabilization system protein ParE
VISRKDAETFSRGRKRGKKSKAVSAGVDSLNLLVSRQARADIREGAHYYDTEDKTSNVTARFLNAVGAAFDTVTEAPQRWPRVQGLPPNRSMHYYVMQNFPYTVVYQRRGEDTVEIVAVAHHKRQSKYWLVGADAAGPRR